MTSLQIIPLYPPIYVGQRVSMRAMAGYSDQTVQIVTSETTWQSDDPTIVSILPNGRSTALQSGTTTIHATYRGVTAALQLYIGSEYYEDCYGYDPATLKVVRNGGGYALADNFGSFIAVFVSAQDAANGLAIGRRYGSICWFGRLNSRPDQWPYIVNFWLRPTGVVTTVTPEDCTAYSPGSLQVVDLGAQGWAVMDGSTRIALLDDEPDAELTLKLAQQYSSHCFIGRGNTQPSPDAFILEYWQ